MASRKFLGVVFLYALFVACVRADAEADAEADADPEADPAGCCSRPTTFIKGKKSESTSAHHMPTTACVFENYGAHTNENYFLL